MELYIHKLKISLSRNTKKSFKKFLDPDCYLDHPQNLISSSLYHFRHFLKISSKSVHKFLSYVSNQQTNPAKNIISLAIYGNYKLKLPVIIYRYYTITSLIDLYKTSLLELIYQYNLVTTIRVQVKHDCKY